MGVHISPGKTFVWTIQQALVVETAQRNSQGREWGDHWGLGVGVRAKRIKCCVWLRTVPLR